MSKALDSRVLIGATAGAGIGAAAMALGSAAGLNRPLVALTVVLALATTWSAAQWLESTDAGAAADPRIPFPEPDDVVAAAGGATPHPTDTANPNPSSDAAPAADADSQRRHEPTSVAKPTPEPGRTPGAIQADAVPDLTPTEPDGPITWVTIADLANDVRLRELQCGHCASYDIAPTPGNPSVMTCRRCRRRTELHPSDRPHVLRVRSNPEREAARAAPQPVITVPSAPAPNPDQESTS